MAITVCMVEGHVGLVREVEGSVMEKVSGLGLVAGLEVHVDLIKPLDGIHAVIPLQSRGPSAAETRWEVR